MLASLWLPILLSGVALFVASFLSWMVLQLHKTDWRKLRNEDDFLNAGRELGLAPGNYMFPCAESAAEMKSPEYEKRWNEGPAGIMTVYPRVNMPRNLGLTLLYFLVVSFCLAYLATLALPRGADSLAVFRFVSTAAFLVFLAAMVQHAIWFHCRIVGHVIESIAYAAIVGGLFAIFWPK